MPYPGVKPGSDTQAKIDRCVKDVMAKNPGWDKSRAIATCRASIEKREGVMPKTKKGKTARQRRKEMARKAGALSVAEDPMADIKAEEVETGDEYLSLEEFMNKNPIPDEELGEEIGEKYWDGPMSLVDIDPPTDFDELEEERKVRENAEKVREVSWDASTLLSNIVNHPALDPAEKGDKIKKVGDDFSKRLANIVYDGDEDKDYGRDDFEPEEKELEMAEARMWARLAGDTGLIAKLAMKAKLGAGTRNDLPDSAFACVMEGGKKDDGGNTMPRSLRHLPIHDKAHVRNALARLPQMLARGGESAEIARRGRAKVMAAAKKMGIGKASKDHNNGILVEKDHDGNYRWIGWVTNNFRDRERDIISDAAHKEYIEFLDEHPNAAPEFWTWHTKGTARQSKADVWLYHEGFVIMSGSLTDAEAYRLMKAISEDEIGMSHGFFAWRSPTDEHLITKYRTFEVSDLPLKNAANPWTTIEATIKEVSSMSKEKLDYLKKLLPEGFVDGLLEDVEESKQMLIALGIDSKEIEGPDSEAEEKEAEETKELTPETEEALKSYFGDDFEEIKEFVGIAKEAIPVMAKEIMELKKALLETEKDSEDTLADMIEGANSKRTKAMAGRPSESKGNLADDEEVKPPQIEDVDENWFSKVTGTQAIEEPAAKQ